MCIEIANMLTLCGCRPVLLDAPDYLVYPQRFLPRLSLTSQTTILSTTFRTVLTQKYVNDLSSLVSECQYDFPLYDGVSVVGFLCQVGSRTIEGTVEEKVKAEVLYEEALAEGETAGLLAQGPTADVFSTKIGNIPAGETINIVVTYVGELKHDVGAESIRFTIPTNIAPRYEHSIQGRGTSVNHNYGAAIAHGDSISIIVDIDMAEGCLIRELRSPSHPVAVTLGNTSRASSSDQFTGSRASASLSQKHAELDRDFVLEVVNKACTTPKAVLEAHPGDSRDRALMVTLVPSFELPPAKSEIILVADRSGSMQSKIPTLVSALKIFLKSLPVGIYFNICSFGTSHTFLWESSHLYTEQSLDEATQHVDTFAANYGGTETFEAVKASIEIRKVHLDLALILCTDGHIWQQQQLFTYLNKEVQDSKSAVRVFPLGIGNTVSSGLMEGVARAGKGFASIVGENEKLDAKVVRMLKAALTENTTNYRLEVNYGPDDEDDDGFVLVERVTDSLDAVLLDDLETEEIDMASNQAYNSQGFQKHHTSENVEAFDALGREPLYAKLPAIAVPNIIQTPQEILPLYPSTRTTVYLLISPNASHRKPSSVTLKASSSRGPLEFQIPIEILTEAGETIHQLAARKAIGELEEGRGWLGAAKDRDGTLLKQKYASPSKELSVKHSTPRPFGTKELEARETQYQQMVEREAVRLGVQYQVGGKWCSFVAVEGETKTVQAGSSYAHVGDRGRPLGPSQYSPLGGTLFCSAASRMSGRETPSPLPSPTVLDHFCGFSMTPSSAFGGISSPACSPTRYGYYQCNLYTNPGEEIHGTSSSASTAPGRKRGRQTRGVSPTMDASYRPRKVGSKASVASKPVHSAKLDRIISLQRFQGCWELSHTLLETCGVDKTSTSSKMSAKVSSQEPSRQSVWATILAIVYLERKMAADEDTWVLVVKKAKEFLQQSGIDMQKELEESPLKELLKQL